MVMTAKRMIQRFILYNVFEVYTIFLNNSVSVNSLYSVELLTSQSKVWNVNMFVYEAVVPLGVGYLDQRRDRSEKTILFVLTDDRNTKLCFCLLLVDPFWIGYPDQRRDRLGKTILFVLTDERRDQKLCFYLLLSDIYTCITVLPSFVFVQSRKPLPIGVRYS